MKLLPLAETVDASHRLAFSFDDPIFEWLPPSYVMHCRPTETEADLIAMSARPGYGARQPVVRFKQGTDCDGGRDCDVCWESCASFFAFLAEERADEMEAYGVTWDPEIRL